MSTCVTWDERVVGWQHRRRVCAGEVDGAQIARRGVAVSVLGGDGHIVGDAGDGRAGQAGNGQGRGRGRPECGGAVGGTVSGRAVVPGNAGAVVRDHAVAPDVVGATDRVIKVGRIGVQVARRICAGGRVVSHREDRGDDRRGGAGAAVDDPTGVGGTVDGHTGVRIGNGRDVGLHAIGAGRVGLPGGLGLVARAAAAGARVITRIPPRRLGPASRAGVLDEGGASYGHDIGGGRRVGDVVIVARAVICAVTGAGGDGHAGMVEIGGVVG